MNTTSTISHIPVTLKITDLKNYWSTDLRITNLRITHLLIHLMVTENMQNKQESRKTQSVLVIIKKVVNGTRSDLVKANIWNSKLNDVI